MIKSSLVPLVLLLWLYSAAQTLCNPIGFDPSMAPYYMMPQIPMAPPFMMAPQFDPYTAMTAHNPYIYNSPFMPMHSAESRRSITQVEKPIDRSANKAGNSADTDEQKALDGLPVSFVSKNLFESLIVR